MKIKVIPCTTGHRVAEARVGEREIEVTYRHVAAWEVTKERVGWEAIVGLTPLISDVGMTTVTEPQVICRLLEPNEELPADEASYQARYDLRWCIDSELKLGAHSIDKLRQRFEPKLVPGLVVKLVDSLVREGMVVGRGKAKAEVAA
jgi:hypothetical protein